VQDLGLKLHPLDKLKLYRVMRDSVFHQMDRDDITPERADTILTEIKDSVIAIETPAMAKAYYMKIGEQFPELVGVKHQLQLQEDEKVDRVISLLIEHIFNKGDLELATRLMEEAEEFHEKNQSLQLAEKLEAQYPDTFKRAVEEIAHT
jgi:hypothetical protein